ISKVFRRNNKRGVELINFFLNDNATHLRTDYREIEKEDITCPEYNINKLITCIPEKEHDYKLIHQEWKYSDYARRVERLLIAMLILFMGKIAKSKPLLFLDMCKGLLKEGNYIINGLILYGLNETSYEYSDEVIEIICE